MATETGASARHRSKQQSPARHHATVEQVHFEIALLPRKRQPPQRGAHSGENRVFRLNATFDFQKKSKVICSRAFC
ncbi:hypothetical protein [Desulfovibrio sp. ZJ200]|uniref:hypothetical protein n=1 Tax=Desulfovibrio sp. ZJ200 TaxID=2709792 RepID=UPI00197D8A7E|nr:hypothetical protein [Desulfovibrio sp. ZJ200]